MSNGNIFINASGGQGGAGIMYEVNQSNNIIWQYNGGGPAKAFRYECEYPGIISLLNNPCSVDINNVDNSEISIFPNPSNGVFNIEISLNDAIINIVNVYGQSIPFKIINSKIDLSAHPDGVYFIQISSSENNIYSKKLILYKNEF
jgi:hypothetical protein